MKIIAYQKQAEAVVRRDLGMMQQGLLLFQVLIVRVLFQRCIDRAPDPLPHFRSSRIGEGQHQKTVNLHRMLLIQKKPDDPCRQNRCFSGSSRRADKEILMPALDHLCLFGCPCSFTHRSFRFFLSSRSPEGHAASATKSLHSLPLRPAGSHLSFLPGSRRSPGSCTPSRDFCPLLRRGRL